MFGLLKVVLLFVCVALNNCEDTVQDDGMGEVIFVNLLNRHGDRTPSYLYPTDPYNNGSYWPEKKGQLTNTGKRQTFELGQWLRRRYDSLLTDRYSSDVIYIQSSDIDRTLMSAECVLAGMFPPNGVQEWSEELRWQPIPVHTTALNRDKLLGQPMRTPCPAYLQEKLRVFYSDVKVGKLNQTFADLFEWTNKNSGANFTLLNLYDMYDALFVEDLNNLTLPGWTKKVFPEPMQEANVYTYQFGTWNTKMARLMTGVLLQDMIQHMIDKVNNRTTRNVHIYSGHDQTIVNLLNPLGAFNHVLPPYASCLMLELRAASDGNHYVTMYYRNSTSAEPYLLTVAGCAPVCPLDQFISLSQPLIPEDWDRECSLNNDNDDDKLNATTVMALVASVSLALLVLVALWIYFHYYHRRNLLRTNA